jgi:hypothetical protein
MPQLSTGEHGEEARAARRAEVDQIVAVLREALPDGLRRRELARRLGARRWGPGRLGGALRQAVAEGLIRRAGWRTWRLVEPNEAD